MAIALELPGSIKSLNPVPVDWSYGPFANVAAAKAAVPLSLRYDGLTVQITGSGNFYWTQSDLTDTGLIAKGGVNLINGSGLTFSTNHYDLGGTLTTPTIITTGLNDFTINLTGNNSTVSFSAIGDDTNITFANTNGTGIGVASNSVSGSSVTIQGTSLIGEIAFLFFDLNNTQGAGAGVIFQDTRSTTLGIQYAADYSTGFTARSLVDKGYVLGAKTYTGIQTFPSSDIVLRNPANTFGYTFVGSAIAANRNLTLPLLTGNDVVVTEAMTQTLTNKTINGSNNTITNVSLTSAVTGILPGANGGTGVANTSKTITLGGNLTTSGAFATTLTTTAITSVTLPVSGILLSTTSLANGNGTTWNSATPAYDLGGTSIISTNILISGTNKYFRVGFGKSEVLDGGSLSYPSRGIHILSNNYTDINDNIYTEGVIIDSHSDATNYSKVNLYNNGVSLNVFSTGSNRSVTLDNQSLFYAADYSATYSTRSLVDKGYVLGAKTYTGAQTFKVGAAGAGLAPIYIPAGTNLTTTEAGALENNGTHLFFTFANSGTRFQLDQQISGLTTSVMPYATSGTTLGDSEITRAAAGVYQLTRNVNAQVSFSVNNANAGSSVSTVLNLSTGTTGTFQITGYNAAGANPNSTQISGSGDIYFNQTGTNKVGISTIFNITYDRFFHIEFDDATTNAVAYIQRLCKTTSGTAAIGLGVGIEFEVENASAINKVGGTFELVSTNITNTTEAFDFVFKNMNAGAAAAETFRIASTGRASVGGIALPLSTFDINGSLGTKIRTITASTTAAATDYTLLCDATGGVVAVTLPTASGATGRIYIVKKIDASANNVTLATVDGGTKTITTRYAGFAVQSDGSLWYVIASF